MDRISIYENTALFLLSQANTKGENFDSSFETYEDLLSSISGISYIINNDYRIVTYSHTKWNEFAQINNGDKLLDVDYITGKSVLEFFSGNKVRGYYKKLYDAILNKKRDEIRISAKCDAPEVFRDNIIYLTPIYANPKTKEDVIGVLHQSLIVKVKERESITKNRSDLEIKGKFLEICSICKFVLHTTDDSSKWISLEQYYQYGGIDPINLPHSICNDCGMMINEFV